MSENIDITKYFSENKSGKFEDIFDQITNMSESVRINDSLSSESKNQNEEYAQSSGEDEPMVCKIFQEIETKKPQEHHSTNFFDAISDTTGNYLKAEV